MISYLQGTVFRRYDDRAVILVAGVGYEVLVPEVVRQSMPEEGEVQFHIMYYQSERTPRPVLIGFNSEIEREFFERFITVEGIGPMAAVKAFILPVGEIAAAIEERDIVTLRRLPGIGARTAEKIVASLNGKVGKFCLIPRREAAAEPISDALVAVRQEVERVLITQMGYKTLEAHRMVGDALKSNPAITTAEQLFEAVYRARKAAA